MASSWSTTFIKDAEKGTGFTPLDIPDDLYDAEIIEIGEPKDVPNPFKEGEMQIQFHIQWQLLGDDLPEDASLRQFVNIPDAYIHSGFLNEKSNLFKLMGALGFDMTGRFRVDPPSWVGRRARVMVENKENKEGELRPRISDVKPIRRRASKEE